MTKYLSYKIKIISFILIIFVLYIHSGFHVDEIGGMYWNHFIQEFIGGKLGRVAVPMFFVISGYLFFINTDGGILSIKRKILSRGYSIVLPYVYGCIFFVVFLVTIQYIPGVAQYMNSDIKPLFNKPIIDIVRNMFWISDGGTSPMAFQLWFLRDLIVIIAITPVLFYVLKLFTWWALPVLFALSFISVTPDSLLSSLFWFSTGGVFSITKTLPEIRKSKIGLIILALYLLISLFEQINEDADFEYLQKCTILIGIIGVWFSYDFFVRENSSLKGTSHLSLFCSFTFFIYLYHEPTLNIVRKLIVIVLGKNSIGYLLSYLLSPFVFIVFAVFAGTILKKLIPKTYSGLVGGRI